MTFLAFLIQQDVEVVDEFRQHDSVVTVMVKRSSQASPKHYENMTGGVNGGGGHRKRLGNCLGCARSPLLIYIGGRDRGEAKGRPK